MGKQSRRQRDIRAPIQLDLGCGRNKQQGFIGLDRTAWPGVDIVHDIEELPWPLEDGSCGVIKASHVMEHIKPWFTIPVMDEAWRVLEDGGVMLISMPYGTGYRYVQDPTHCNPWNETTPAYFCPAHDLYEIYRPKPWHLENLFWLHERDMEVAFRKIADQSE